ncbi:uncharacterized protein VTP21DRAFT_4284 [Calcarisporiella thermophila]|uniref:uncharacterized protein n=1 Tax=Calcarisporiella thermophila TaxID=911321 RepID=UPI003742AF36
MVTLSNLKPTTWSVWMFLALCFTAAIIPQASAQEDQTLPNVPPSNNNVTTGDKWILLKGGTIIAWSDEKNDLDIIRGGDVLIQNDRIVAVGQDVGDAPEGSDIEVVNVTDHIVTPGFIDTHKHCWEHLYQTLGPDVTLNDYLYKFSPYAEITTHFEPEDSYISTLMAILDALNGGVTSVLDFAHGAFTPEHTIAMLKAGIASRARVFHGYAITPIASRISKSYDLSDAGMNDTNGWRWRQLEQWSKVTPWENGRVQLGLSWDAGRNGMEGKLGFQRAHDWNLTFVTMHDVGYPLQVSGYGSKAVYQIYEWGYLNSSYPIIFAHGTLLDGADLNLLRKYGHFISVTPESEHHYEHGQLYTHHNLEQASLGIDTSFTFSSDILTQMRLQLQSTRNIVANPVHFNMKFANNSAMTANQVFLLGTRNGGLTMRRPDIGVIKVGAKADIVVFNTNNTAISAFYDPVAAVVLQSNVGDIEHVLVDGKWVKRNFQLQGLDWSRLQADFKASARKIQKAWLEYDKDWGPLRVAMLKSLNYTEAMFQPVRPVAVDPRVPQLNLIRASRRMGVEGGHPVSFPLGSRPKGISLHKFGQCPLGFVPKLHSLDGVSSQRIVSSGVPWSSAWEDEVLLVECAVARISASASKSVIHLAIVSPVAGVGGFLA